MSKPYDNVYHLHTPKTGGIWFNTHVLDEIQVSIERAKIEYRVDHASWTGITDSTYIINIWRDPAKRIVSHFAYSVENFSGKELYEGYDNWTQEKYKEITVENLMAWVEENEPFLANYQSKFLVHEKKNVKIGPFYLDDPEFNSLVIDEELLFERVLRVNLLLRNTQLSHANQQVFMDKILNDLMIPYVKPNYVIDKDANASKESNRLWSELSPTQIAYLYEFNKLDSHVFFSDSFFWNDGK